MPASKELQANASSSSSRGDNVVVAVSNVAVRFAPPEELITHIPTISIDDMSDEEHRATYDTDEDGTNRQQSLVECIAAMRTLSLTETELEEQHNHTSRGIEMMMSHQSIQQAKSRKMAVIDAVLDEQDQFDQGYFDADRLAQVSTEAGNAHNSTQRALEAAAADQAYVNDHVRPTVAMDMVRTSPLRRLSSVSSFEAPMMLRRGSNRSVASESSSSTTSSKSTVASVLNDSERMREVRSHP